jgi:hypothetical protein
VTELELLVQRLGKTVLIAVLIVLGLRWLIAQVFPWLPIIGVGVIGLVVVRIIARRNR